MDQCQPTPPENLANNIYLAHTVLHLLWYLFLVIRIPLAKLAPALFQGQVLNEL